MEGARQVRNTNTFSWNTMTASNINTIMSYRPESVGQLGERCWYRLFNTLCSIIGTAYFLNYEDIQFALNEKSTI